jgi:hypothetical protein
MLGTQATPKFWTFFCQRWLSSFLSGECPHQTTGDSVYAK